LTYFTYEVALPLSWADKKNQKPISGTVFLTINFRPIKADEIKKEGKAYQKARLAANFILHPPSTQLRYFLYFFAKKSNCTSFPNRRSYRREGIYSYERANWVQCSANLFVRSFSSLYLSSLLPFINFFVL
jgi:hypothetical protein